MHFRSRRHERYDFHHEIKYVLNPDTTGEIFRGVTVNISDSGLCLYVFNNHLREGQELTIKTILRGFYRTGVVRWYKKIDGEIYKVGLMFV